MNWAVYLHFIFDELTDFIFYVFNFIRAMHNKSLNVMLSATTLINSFAIGAPTRRTSVHEIDKCSYLCKSNETRDTCRLLHQQTVPIFKWIRAPDRRCVMRISIIFIGLNHEVSKAFSHTKLLFVLRKWPGYVTRSYRGAKEYQRLQRIVHRWRWMRNAGKLTDSWRDFCNK